MTSGVSVDVFAIELRGAQFQDARAGGGHVLHHHVQVHLLRHRGGLATSAAGDRARAGMPGPMRRRWKRRQPSRRFDR